MSGLITNIGLLVTASTSWINTVITQITSEGNELILLFVLFSFVGVGIGLVKRLIRL